LIEFTLKKESFQEKGRDFMDRMSILESFRLNFFHSKFCKKITEKNFWADFLLLFQSHMKEDKKNRQKFF